ncbi:MAG: SDR family NAD(P)-dependent oxidoreductase [Prevotella sp.]|jgi:NAD(P)-dependent dehydrogenase (short-subunit alcohol dehydrogenase family)|nr:SDR family NAD(P)-dependent oxidoreductase [Prevotella sp.]
MKKIILITGATNGIGKAAALALAKLGHQIIIHGRNEALAKDVQQEIISESKNPNVDYLIADLFLMREVRKLAEDFKKKYDRLDVLMNNAGGVMGKQREETAEGIEKTIALDLLAPYLLTSLLLSELQNSPEARIVNTASGAHSFFAKPDFNDIELRKKYTANLAYGNAKLYFMMASQVMSDRLKKSYNGKITINMMHPGAVASNILAPLRKRRVLGAILIPIMKLLMKTPEQGADTLVYLADSDEVKGMSGLYFIKRKPAKVNEKYISGETKKIVWDFCVSKTGKKFIG